MSSRRGSTQFLLAWVKAKDAITVTYRIPYSPTSNMVPNISLADLFGSPVCPDILQSMPLPTWQRLARPEKGHAPQGLHCMSRSHGQAYAAELCSLAQ